MSQLTIVTDCRATSTAPLKASAVDAKGNPWWFIGSRWWKHAQYINGGAGPHLVYAPRALGGDVIDELEAAKRQERDWWKNNQ